MSIGTSKDKGCLSRIDRIRICYSRLLPSLRLLCCSLRINWIVTVGLFMEATYLKQSYWVHKLQHLLRSSGNSGDNQLWKDRGPKLDCIPSDDCWQVCYSPACFRAYPAGCVPDKEISVVVFIQLKLLLSAVQYMQHWWKETFCCNMKSTKHKFLFLLQRKSPVSQIHPKTGERLWTFVTK